MLEILAGAGYAIYFVAVFLLTLFVVFWLIHKIIVRIFGKVIAFIIYVFVIYTVGGAISFVMNHSNL